MSTNGESENGVNDPSGPKVKKHDSGAADLERVTDYAEEKEISVHDMRNALAAVDEGRAARSRERAELDRELAKVTIKKTDVDLIVNEMEIGRTEAERCLRLNEGDVVKALLQLTE